MIVDIKNISGAILLSTTPNEGCKRKLTLQKEDYILLKFSLENPIYFKLGTYVECDFGLFEVCDLQSPTFNTYNPQIQISAESETKRSIFREKDKTKRSKKESAQHSKSRNKSFVMTSVSAL